MVKATDFKLEMHIPMDRLHMTPSKNLIKHRNWPEVI